MTALETPAANAPAAEWGSLAVAIPDYGWLPGMLNLKDGTRYMGSARWAWDDPYRHHAQGIADDDWPDPDDPATAGCLLALLGPRCLVRVRILPLEGPGRYEVVIPSGMMPDGRPHRVSGINLGRACIAAAAAIGRWPGGAS